MRVHTYQQYIHKYCSTYTLTIRRVGVGARWRANALLWVKYATVPDVASSRGPSLELFSFLFSEPRASMLGGGTRRDNWSEILNKGDTSARRAASPLVSCLYLFSWHPIGRTRDARRGEDVLRPRVGSTYVRTSRGGAVDGFKTPNLTPRPPRHAP